MNDLQRNWGVRKKSPVAEKVAPLFPKSQKFFVPNNFLKKKKKKKNPRVRKGTLGKVGRLFPQRATFSATSDSTITRSFFSFFSWIFYNLQYRI